MHISSKNIKKITYKSLIISAIIFLCILIINSDNKSPAFDEEAIKNSKYWEEKINILGPGEAYMHLKNTLSKKHYGLQHAAAHAFGSALYDLKKIKGVKICDDAFQFGCFHTFMAKAVEDNGSNAIEYLKSECNKNNNKAICIHGIGHGIMADLDKINVFNGLKICQGFDDEESRKACAGGIFMEYNFNTMSDPSGSGVLARKLHENEYYPCEEIENIFEEICYFNQAVLWVTLFNENYEKTGSLCDKISETRNKDACLYGLGSSVASHSVYSIEKTVANCRKISSELNASKCIIGAAISYSSIENYKNIWNKLCNYVEFKLQDKCINKAS